MAQSIPNPPPGFESLSASEKIEYVEALRESILERSEVPVPDWHRELIRERLDTYRADPSGGRPWSDVRAELERKYPSRP